MHQMNSPANEVCDYQGALARLGGDKDLYSDLVGFFVEDAPPLLDELRAAIAAENSTVTKQSAHKLKGLCLGCGGVQAAGVAQKVEEAATADELSDAESLADRLAAEIDSLVDATSPYRK